MYMLTKPKALLPKIITMFLAWLFQANQTLRKIRKISSFNRINHIKPTYSTPLSAKVFTYLKGISLRLLWE